MAMATAAHLVENVDAHFEDLEANAAIGARSDPGRGAPPPLRRPRRATGSATVEPPQPAGHWSAAAGCMFAEPPLGSQAIQGGARLIPFTVLGERRARRPAARRAAARGEQHGEQHGEWPLRRRRRPRLPPSPPHPARRRCRPRCRCRPRDGLPRRRRCRSGTRVSATRGPGCRDVDACGKAVGLVLLLVSWMSGHACDIYRCALSLAVRTKMSTVNWKACAAPQP